MAIYFVTGKLGAGKTLASVGRIRDYLNKGSQVATNLNLNLENLISKKSKMARVTRLPDKPIVEDMFSIGYGNKTVDEGKNGLIVLDECGTWFNSRNWNDKGRKELLDWFLHCRKYGWDVIFIVQDISIIDKQAKDTLCEHLVNCRRLDRVSIPFVTFFIKTMTGYRITFPRLHIANVRYGVTASSLIVDRWIYRGTTLYDAYDTKQIFTDVRKGMFMYLPPWYTYYRHLKPLSERIRIYLEKSVVPVAVIGVVALVLSFLSLGVTFFFPAVSEPLSADLANKNNKVDSLNSVTSALDSRVDFKIPVLPSCGPFKNMFISGSALRNDEFIYLLDDGQRVLMSTQFMNGAYRLKPKGSCYLLVTGAGCKSIIECGNPVRPVSPGAAGLIQAEKDKPLNFETSPVTRLK